MATNSVVKSFQGTLTTTDEDIVKLTQYWDRIEIENQHATNAMYVRLDGTAATAAGAGTDFIGPGDSKVFGPGGISREGIPGNTTTPPHYISLIGVANAYSVSGIAGV